MGTKTMSEEHKQRIAEARERSIKERVSIEIDKFTIESYEYGYKVFETDSPTNNKFYKDILGALNYIHSSKIKKSGSRDVESLIDSIRESAKVIYDASKVIEGGFNGR